MVAEIIFAYIYYRVWQFVQAEATEEAAYPETSAVISGWYYLVGDSLYSFACSSAGVVTVYIEVWILFGLQCACMHAHVQN